MAAIPDRFDLGAAEPCGVGGTRADPVERESVVPRRPLGRDPE